MNRLATVLSRLRMVFGDLGVEWALVGGMAVSVRTEPRFTRDVDAAVVTPDDEAAEHLIVRLGQRGYRMFASVEQTKTERLATARMMPPGEVEGGIIVDLLFASSGIEKEMVSGADIIEIAEDLRVPVCRTAHLLVAKVLARDDKNRPQDAMDIRALLGVMNDADWQEASRLARLVQDRGYARGRDLVSGLDKLQAEA